MPKKSDDSHIVHELIAVRDMRVHPHAQRKIVPATLKKINRDLDLGAIGTLHGVRYPIDGVTAVWIVDGQHRLTVLQAAGLMDLYIGVDLHTDVTDDARASDLFIKLNTRGAVSAFDRFANEVRRGDSVANEVLSIAAKHGFRIDRKSRDGVLSCVTALKDLYQRDGGAALAKTLATVTAAWGHSASAAEGKLIEGIGLVYATHNGKVDQPALVKKLAKRAGGASGLLGSAKGLRDIQSKSLGRCVAELTIQLHNRGRRVGKLDPI